MNKDQKQLLTNFEKDFTKDPYFSFLKKLQEKFTHAEIYLVGGTVRDIFLGRESKDLDIVIRSVKGKDLEKFLEKEGRVDLVGKSFGIFKFNLKSKKKDLPQIDIALPRTEHSFNTGGYRDFDIQSDPDLEIEKDLERRDFTINAMALIVNCERSTVNCSLVDPYNGMQDLENKTIKTVGDPRERFKEDYTRMLRAIRFSVQLHFKIEEKTYKNIYNLRKEIMTIPAERLQEEVTKIIMATNAKFGIELLKKVGLLHLLMPELEAGIGVKQNRSHIYDVFEHSIRALDYAAKQDYSLEIRFGALFHDIGKPETKEGEGKEATFHNHEMLSAKKTRAIMKRLKYSREISDKVVKLVRNHMFYYTLGEITDAAVRRLIVRIGKENIGDQLQVRFCDRIGMGRPKAKPYKLVELEKRIQEVQMDPISVKMLKLNGDEVMKVLGIEPSVRIKYLMEALFSEVLDDPKKNTKKYLTKRLKELHKESDEDLAQKAPNFTELEREKKKKFFKVFKGVE